jgi:hypothetical protein
LVKAIVSNQKTKEMAYFLCGDWLEGKNNMRELPA